ncbi:class I SAM-dependent methyltransferase [Flavisolibacter sp. BT320]|nr:class I SAM-dependent methyltransferase [Flavisolibacter longurius]
MHPFLFSLALLLSLSFLRCGTTGQSGRPATDTAYTYKTPHPDGTGKVYMGREIAHVMSASGAGWLERSSRQQEEDADAAIAALPLRPGSTVADVGAGSGYYTFRIARRVRQGRVYAVEVQDEFVASLQARAEREGASNVTVIRGSDQEPNLPDSSIDLAIMVDVYHELAYPKEMLVALHKALRPDGKLLLLEYRAEDPSIPIKALHKLSVAQAQKELAASGFVLAEYKQFLPIQHYLLFRKKL